MWRETTKHERNRKIFREELDGFLPEKILDFHVHILNSGVIAGGATYSCGGHPLAKYDFEDLNLDLAEIYPGRETFAVCFGFPETNYDRSLNNRYVGENCDGKRFFGLRLFDPSKDGSDALLAELKQYNFRGLKPYPNYVSGKDLRQVEIKEMLPEWAMEMADELGLILMLHIPRPGRLADDKNQKQILELCRRYPGAKIVLAHIGRAYFLKNIEGNLERLKEVDNLWYDLAMVNHWEVLEYLFKTVNPARILYATDIPVALAPGKSVEINNQYTYVTPVPWELSISDDKKKLEFTSFLYEELRAIRKGVEKAGLGRDFVRAMFFENGMRLLRPASANEAKAHGMILGKLGLRN